MYKFDKQIGVVHRDYLQPYPFWGKFEMQVTEFLPNLFLGWFDCNDLFVTEFQFNSKNISIDLMLQNAHYEKILTAKIYQNSQSISNPATPILYHISEPFKITKFEEDMQEIQYQNNEPFDELDFSNNFSLKAYYRMIAESPNFEEEGKVYLKSNGQTQRLTGRLLKKTKYNSEYQPNYRNELLSKINILDKLLINQVEVVASDSEIENVNKYSLSQFSTIYSNVNYNFINSNCL